ncbi:hypothetical protein B9479_006987 [Cryptococcus floricola]|uniref:Cyclin N-terminal domain-containing protein n=1 Tax=Cryptococcus floricola TaxID=2591691 RepID=A0A5D3ANL4_9TREE|nr:hypothetical protein B9479_006987 [Cryptococcus floricola]
MPSGIPTRRAPRLADENAPVPTAPTTRTRTKAAIPSTTSHAVKPTTSIPVIKRTRSTATASSQGKEAENAKPAPAERERRMLGEVRNGKGAGEKKDGGVGKEGKKGVREERKPLAMATTRQGQRPTRAASAQPAGAGDRDRVTGKRKAPVVSSKTTGRARSTGAEPLQDARTRTVVKVEQKPIVEDEEPRAKRRKTSSPALQEVDEERYEAEEEGPKVEGREVLLSSGSKGAVGLRSPKAKSKDHGWMDLDAEDEGDPTMVSEYVVEAFQYMMDIQPQTMPRSDYMDNQAELEWKMRQILMDWIIEVHSKFRLLPETLFIATNLVDRFLSKRVISLVKFQLVGLTALFIASKYEEVCCPGVEHFLKMSDGGYTLEELLKAERYMLSTLGFDMSYPNPLNFIRRISKADGYDIQTRTVAKYLVEISCVDEAMLGYEPSMLAAASMWLGRLCLERGTWGPNLVHYSTYSEEEIVPCAQAMLNYILDPEFSESTTFYKKYASKKHMKASVYVRTWAVNLWPESTTGESEIQGRELEVLITEERERSDGSSS